MTRRQGTVVFSTVSEQWNHLAEEIKTGILSLTQQPLDTVQRNLEDIRLSSSSSQFPESAYITALFRKYADVANEAIDDLKQSVDKFGVIADLPSLYDLKEDKELVGWQAVKSNMFWIRAMTGVFSLFSFALLTSVPYISYSQFNPSWDFHESCELFQGHYFQGAFDYRPYQLLLYIGALLAIYCTAICFYYILPVDSENRKVLPFCNRADGAGQGIYIPETLPFIGRLTQVSSDGILLLSSLIAVILASAYFLSAEKFVVNRYAAEVYFTLPTFYATYMQTSPQCLVDGPCEKIQIAIVLHSLAIVCHMLSFQISYSSYRYEVKTRRGSTRGTSSRSDYNQIEGEISHLPLASDEREDDDDIATV